MSSINSRFLLVVIFFFIPILGIATSIIVSRAYEHQYERIIIDSFKKNSATDVSENQAFLKEINLTNICKNKSFDKILGGTCNEYKQIEYLGYVSALTLLFCILALLAVVCLSEMATNNRKVLFYVFRPGLFLSQIISSIMVISYSAIIIFSIYFVEAFYIGRIHIFMIAILGFIAIDSAFVVCFKALTPIKSAEARIFGKCLPKNNYPQIWQFVETIAKLVGTAPPRYYCWWNRAEFFCNRSKYSLSRW